MDHDQYEDAVTNECLQEEQPGVAESESFGQPDGQRSSGGGETFESQSSYNPFDIHMGQMTVYRLHITCSCSEFNNKKVSPDGESKKDSPHKNGKKCARILPMKEQPWSGYMGSHADSYLLKKINVMPTPAQTTTSTTTPLKPSV
jgi:hypothetical protein